jgi:L-glyceraldehyde 3-phosphate reductase
MAREAAASRYDSMVYRACGRSGLRLPAIALGAWETFGGYRGEDVARECLFRAFDLGVTYFDLANNYGTPPGNAEAVCGRVLRELPRDEMIIASKAGYRMWPGPYGDGGSRKYLVASCDQSLGRMGLEYFDIFYSHRPDPATPIEETLGALDQLVRSGKALYAAVSNYDGSAFARALRVGGPPIVAEQSAYSLLNRKVEKEVLPLAAASGVGFVAYAPLASGMLTSKYLGNDIPAGSRAAERWGREWVERGLTDARRRALLALNEMAKARGQTLAQLSLAWVLRRPEVTCALIGASSVSQLEENVGALANLTLSADEIARIDALLGS